MDFFRNILLKIMRQYLINSNSKQFIIDYIASRQRIIDKYNQNIDEKYLKNNKILFTENKFPFFLIEKKKLEIY